jgi:hypothetical protein
MAVKSKKAKKHKNKSKGCPTCGSVECFERPRFFSGQSLTDEDLNAAQRYVIEKNRLHNRYLVGTGVACGLAVRCDPCCDGSVIIEPGYAIDCCGNDIVVCKEASFNILDCFKQPETPYCDRDLIEYKSQCDRESKEYCLAIFYDEEPIKPVTALIRDNGCKNVRCEPSRTRETFRFELVEKPEPDRCDIDLRWLQSPRPDMLAATRINPLINILKNLVKLAPSDSFLCRVLTCAFGDKELWDIIGELKNVGGWSNNSTIYSEKAPKFFNKMRSYALNLYQKEPKIRCNLLKEIQDILMPSANVDGFIDPKQGNDALLQMFLLTIQLVIDCICDAMLVPCKDCNEEDGVILACLTFKGDKIEKICNISRQQLITGPALQYWTQPLFAALHQVAESFCCELDLMKLGGREPKTPERPPIE